MVTAVWVIAVALAATETWADETVATQASDGTQVSAVTQVSGPRDSHEAWMSGPPVPHEPWVSDEPVAEPHERPPFDPPWPRTGPVVTAPPVRVVRVSFESVQVNVDENGNNIVGDAANEPSIAVDPTDPDRIVIGWRQFDDVRSNFRQAGVAYSHDAGRTWTFRGVLTPGVFRSDPVLGSDADGNFYFYSLEDDWTCDMFKSADGGLSWSKPVYAYGGDKAWFAIDRTDGIGRGNIYGAWDYAGCCEPYRFSRSIDGAASFQEPIRLLGNPIWGTVDIGIDGEVFIAGVKRSERSIFLLTRSSDAKNRETVPTFDLSVRVAMGGRLDYFLGHGPNPGGLLGQVWVVVDRSDGPRRGYLYMLSSVNPPGPEPLDVMFARSRDNGETWSDPLRVNDDPSETRAWQWFGTVAVAANSGRIDAVWNDTRNTGKDYMSELFYAYSTDGGETWSKNVPVSPAFDSYIGWPRQDKLGDYYDMVSDELGAMVAYAATFNDEQDVYFLRIAIDCNQNGLHDGDDIASGRSKDVNGNGIPDECEGVNCDLMRKFKVKCRRGKLKVKVKSRQPEGTQLTIDNNGDARVLTLNGKGKAKTKWTGQTGKHTVKIVECPDFEEVVDCGQ